MMKRIVVMGVSGCGKSTIGEHLARYLSLPFIEGDHLHPQTNVNWMAQGRPLTDEMRYPWLDLVADRLRAGEGRGSDGCADDGIVVSCSALKRSYRDRLRNAGDVFFVHVDVSKAVLLQRMTQREHFMPVSLLDSQLATLEPLEADENGVVINGELPIDDMIKSAVASLPIEAATIG